MCVRFPYNVRESNFVQNEHKKVKACVIIMRVHICSMFQNSIHPDQIADVQICFSSSPNRNSPGEIIRELVLIYGIIIVNIEDPLWTNCIFIIKKNYSNLDFLIIV